MVESGLCLLVVFLFSLLGLLLFSIWIGSRGSMQFDTGSEYPEGAAMKEFLFLGLFYVNPDDPRGFLPKSQPSFGWTINFRNKLNALVFLFLLVSTVGTALVFANSLL